MTLVLSCITHDYVVQVSDRRLVSLWPDLSLVDDKANKVVAYCNIAAFSYTGLAQINRQKTDDWLINELSPISDPTEYSLSDVCEKIAARATQVFQQGRISKTPKRYTRHTFVCSGWAALAPSEFRSVVGTISNCQDNISGRLLQEAKVEFTARYHLLQTSEPFYLEVTGQPVNDNSKKNMEAQIRACIKKNAGPSPIARILAMLIRETAAKSSTVGRNLLVVSIPKKSVSPNEMSFFGGRIQKDGATFLYIPEDRNEPIIYGPKMVCNGFQVLDMRVFRPGK